MRRCASTGRLHAAGVRAPMRALLNSCCCCAACAPAGGVEGKDDDFLLPGAPTAAVTLKRTLMIAAGATRQGAAGTDTAH